MPIDTMVLEHPILKHFLRPVRRLLPEVSPNLHEHRLLPEVIRLPVHCLVPEDRLQPPDSETCGHDGPVSTATSWSLPFIVSFIAG